MITSPASSRMPKSGGACGWPATGGTSGGAWTGGVLSWAGVFRGMVLLVVGR